MTSLLKILLGEGKDHKVYPPVWFSAGFRLMEQKGETLSYDILTCGHKVLALYPYSAPWERRNKFRLGKGISLSSIG